MSQYQKLDFLLLASYVLDCRNIHIRRNIIFEDPTINKSDYHVTLNFIENNGDAGDIDSVYFSRICQLAI